jgi:hypothetical protein
VFFDGQAFLAQSKYEDDQGRFSLRHILTLPKYAIVSGLNKILFFTKAFGEFLSLC